MDEPVFRMPLYLPAQGAAESEATIVEWHVAEGDRFQKGQVLGQIDSAKSVFDFEAPCEGLLVQVLHGEGETVAYDQAVLEIETADPAMKEWIPSAAAGESPVPLPVAASATPARREAAQTVALLGVGGYLPERVVTNAELVGRFPGISDDYIYQVTGVRRRRWAAEGERPSDMACAASVEAIRKSGLSTDDIDAVILATTTPDVAMPSTACIVQDRLGLNAVPSFDLNAACSGWLYALSMARGMILSRMARNVLTVGVDVQSRLLDRSDQTTCFIFGDGAGAAVVSASTGGTGSSHTPAGHAIREVVLGADTRGLRMARREEPGYFVANGQAGVDPWIRLDGQSLFRFAVESFAGLVRDTITKSGWTSDQTRWVIPHQANTRILKAAAKRSGVPFERFALNLEELGNTSSASIPLALLEIEKGLQPGDKLVLCSVGAGVTTAAVSVEW